MHTTASCSEHKPIVRTAEGEALALTIHCLECNAPPKKPCQQIYWVDGSPYLRTRIKGSHSRRVKDAKELPKVRARISNRMNYYASHR